MRKKYWHILTGIVFLGVILRLIVCLELQHTPSVCSPSSLTDMATYKQLALEILHGKWPSVFDYQPLYYTIFLPFAYLFSPSGGVWSPMLLQILAAAAAIWLTGLSGAMLLGRRGGLLAALLLALSRYHIFYTPFLLLEVLYSLAAALVLYLTMRILLSRRPSPWLFAALGASLSIAVLTRGGALLWIPAVLCILLWHFRKMGWRRLAGMLLLSAACYLVPQTPYMLRNSLSTGHFCGASVAGGKVMILGNSPEAPAAGLEYPRIYHQWVNDAETGRVPVLANILRWAKREPMAFCELCLRKIALFWEHNEIPNNISFVPDADESHLLHWKILLPWSITGTLALAFLLMTLFSHPRRHSTWAFLLMMLSFWGATSAFYLLARFRIGFLPLQSIAASGMLMCIWQKRRRLTSGNRMELYGMLIPLLIALYMVCMLPWQWRECLLPAFYRIIRPQGFHMTYGDGGHVVYDHAALCDGGMIPLAITDAPLKLHKLFSCCKEAHSLKQATRPVHLRILLRILPNASPFNSRRIRLFINDNPASRPPVLLTERFCQWLCWEMEIDNGTVFEEKCRMTVEIPPGCGIGAVVVDRARNYHRSALENEEIPAEAVMEMEIKEK